MCSSAKVHYRTFDMETGVACNRAECLDGLSIDQVWCDCKVYDITFDARRVSCLRCRETSVWRRGAQQVAEWKAHFGYLTELGIRGG